MSEFREADSYLTDSETEDEDFPKPTGDFENSILKMARSLSEAAHAHSLTKGKIQPHIVLRLTRLDPSETAIPSDPRITRTIAIIRDMGIDVELGLRRTQASPPKITSPIAFRPTRKINLDLSVLLALVSDITHAPLPSSYDDAEARFAPSEAYIAWKAKRLTLPGFASRTKQQDLDRKAENNTKKHARALALQAAQEMHLGLFEEITAQLGKECEGRTCESFEFWTTKEARDRCLRILEKIGGPGERQRGHAMFPLTDELSLQNLEDQYWKGSRHPPSCIPLLPIRIFPENVDENSDVVLPPFFNILASTCNDILARDIVPDPRVVRQFEARAAAEAAYSESLSLEMRKKSAGEPFTMPNEILRAAVINSLPKLTAHTVQTLLFGARKGWTTLTANRTSVKAIWRELKAYPVTTEQEVVSESKISQTPTQAAVFWIVNPRSLAEEQRFDFTWSRSTPFKQNYGDV